MLKHKYAFEAIGTQWSIETAEEISVSLKNIIQNAIEAFDKTYSRFRSDSLISQITHKKGSYIFPQNATKLFTFYKKLYDVTGGKVTPLIGDMMERAGYDMNYSFQPQPQIPVLKWEETLEFQGTTLHTHQPVTLDVGAAGKGYLVDCIATIMDENSIEEYVIDASGDILHKGTTSNQVGLEHPLDHTQVIGVAEVQNKSLCASASNRRTWKKGMHHIFDPDEMAPTNEIIASWVIANEALVADGLATALFFTEPKTLRTYFEFDFVRMYASGAVEYSNYFKDRLF